MGDTESQGKCQFLRELLGEVAACSLACGSGDRGACWKLQGVRTHLRLGFVKRRLLRQFSYEHVLTFYGNSAMQEKRPLVDVLLL